MRSDGWDANRPRGMRGKAATAAAVPPAIVPAPRLGPAEATLRWAKAGAHGPRRPDGHRGAAARGGQDAARPSALAGSAIAPYVCRIFDRARLKFLSLSPDARPTLIGFYILTYASYTTLSLSSMNVRSITSQSFGLIGWVSVTAAAATLGGIASTRDVSFYATLVRPAWAPPAWLFGPAWTVLYVLMATSAWLVWRRFGFRDAGNALKLFVVQLALNALWTWLFFAWRQGGLALAELIVLWVMIVITIAMFWKLHRIAGVLLVPYLCWVSFAGVLNYTLWRQNPAIL